MDNLPPLAELVSDLEDLKRAEDDARLNRIRKEQQILDHPEVASVLKDDGSVTVDRITITTGYTRRWDQGRLYELESEIAAAYWPFHEEWKEDRAESRRIEEKYPDLWHLIGEALTLTPRKPGIVIKAKKKEAA